MEDKMLQSPPTAPTTVAASPVDWAVTMCEGRGTCDVTYSSFEPSPHVRMCFECLNVPVGCRAQALFVNQQADGGFLRVQALSSPAFYAPQLAEMEPRVTAYFKDLGRRREPVFQAPQAAPKCSSGVSWEGPGRVWGGARGSLEGPAVLLGGSWEAPRRVLRGSWERPGSAPARPEPNSDNPASRDEPIIFKTKRGHQSKQGGGACRSEIHGISGLQCKPKPGWTGCYLEWGPAAEAKPLNLFQGCPTTHTQGSPVGWGMSTAT